MRKWGHPSQIITGLMPPLVLPDTTGLRLGRGVPAPRHVPLLTPACDIAVGAVAVHRAGRNPHVVFSRPCLPYVRAHACCTLSGSATCAHDPNHMARLCSPAPGGESSTWKAWTGGGGAGPRCGTHLQLWWGDSQCFPKALQHASTPGTPTSPPQPGFAEPEAEAAVTAVQVGWECRAEGTWPGPWAS